MATPNRWAKVDAIRVRTLRHKMGPLIEAEQVSGCPLRQAQLDVLRGQYDELMAKYHRCVARAVS